MNDETTPILMGEVLFKERKLMMSKDLMYNPEKIASNFNMMCLSFSLNHACVVACLAYASAELGDQLGSMCSGILYVTFALTAFLVSNPIVIAIGPKYGLLIGVTGYCLYICGFLFSILTLTSATDIAWIVACLSAAVGGIAGGLLWTSQGRYFSRHAQLYAQSSGMQREKINSDFAAIFATYFLYFEMGAKLLATIVYIIAPAEAPAIVFTLYTVVAMASCVMVAALNDMGDVGSWEFSYKSISHDVGAAGRLVYEDRRLVLIIPFQVAFGFASSMVVYYVLGTVIAASPVLGKAYVGLLSAVVVLSGATISMPLAELADKFGKPYVILLGNVCMMTAGLVFFLADDTTMGTWLVIVPYLVIFGAARGVWENTNKAVIADFFGTETSPCTTAFSATAFFTGYASAMGYMCFYRVTRLMMGGTVLVTAAISTLCYQFAFVVNDQMRAKQSFDARKKEIVKQRFYEYARSRELPGGTHDHHHREDKDGGAAVFTNSMAAAKGTNGIPTARADVTSGPGSRQQLRTGSDELL